MAGRDTRCYTPSGCSSSFTVSIHLQTKIKPSSVNEEMTSSDNIQDLYLFLNKWRLMTKRSDKLIKG